MPPAFMLVFVLHILGVMSRAQVNFPMDHTESKVPSPDVTDKVSSQDVLPKAKCTCTPFYLCFDEEPSSIIDHVVDDRTIITVSEDGEPGECLDILDVCCQNLTPISGTAGSANPSPQPESPSILEVSTQDFTTSPPIQPQSPRPQTPNTPEINLQFPSTDKLDGAASHHVERKKNCGVRNQDGFNFTITGFKDGQAQYGEFPWMVAILTSGRHVGAANLYVGGGSLIDPSVVLTAAHKIIDINDTIKARIGEWNFGSTSEPFQTQDIPVSEIIYHPRYNEEKKSFNYALLVLEYPADLGETVGTICLPSRPGQRFDNQDCIVSGWGKNTFEGRFQRIMKSVTVNMVEYLQCQSAFRKTELGGNFILDRGSVCAGDQGQDACTGDGGAPLVCPDPNFPDQYVQVGISAWGLGCGQQGIPGVYAAVAPAIEWIQAKMSTILTADRIVIGSTARSCISPNAIYTEECDMCIECPECHTFNNKTCKCHKRIFCRGG